MSCRIRVGTSGWVYRHWREVLYPTHLPQSRWFERYADVFDTVEVNFTFYRLPNEEVFKSWHDRAPSNFCFAIKGSRYITHMKRLLDPQEHVASFFRNAEPLSDRMGPVLWQLPPQFTRNTTRLAAFLASLPSAHRHAFEFRDPSWHVDEVFDLLRAYNYALCIADSVKRPGLVRLTADWTYIRFHEGLNSGDYTDQQLDHWAAVINRLKLEDRQVWAYFNNDPHGHAVRNALTLRSLLAPNSSGSL